MDYARRRLVLTLIVPRLGLQDLDLAPEKKIVTAGVEPDVVYAQRRSHVRREMVSHVDRLQPDKRRVAQEIGVRVRDPVLVGPVEGAGARSVGILRRPAVLSVLL